MKKIFMLFFLVSINWTVDAQGEFKRVNITNQQLSKMHNTSGALHRFKDVIQDYNNETDLGKIQPMDPQRMKRIVPFEKKDEYAAAPGRPVIGKYQPPLKTFYPDLYPPDLMIAAGHKFLIISDGGSFSFYDKNGYVLPLKPGGIPSEWKATDFFQWLIDDANANNFSFLQNAPDNITSKSVCGHGDSVKDKRLVKAYDVRVIYEPDIKRFIICAAIRNQVWRNGKSLCDKYAVRIFAYALSVSDDPRDGFMMWYWGKNNYRDWPRISADKDVLIQAHNDGSGDDGTPSIYVISMQDMILGSIHPRWFTYLKHINGTPASVVPVAKFKNGTASTPFDKYEMFLRGSGDNAVLYYFEKDSLMWVIKPPLRQTDIDLEDDVTLGWQDRPVFRNGNIYFSSWVLLEDEETNIHPYIFGFDLYRLPLKISGSDILFNETSPKKLEYPVFYPVEASGNSWQSFEVPAIAVDERGTICTAYGRIGKMTVKKSTYKWIYPEARYFLFYDNESTHRPSQLIKAGEFSSLGLFQPDGWSADRVTIDGHYHIYQMFNKLPKDSYIDFATATPDPQQRFVFWIAHAYSSTLTNKYKMVVTKVAAY